MNIKNNTLKVQKCNWLFTVLIKVSPKWSAVYLYRIKKKFFHQIIFQNMLDEVDVMENSLIDTLKYWLSKFEKPLHYNRRQYQ